VAGEWYFEEHDLAGATEQFKRARSALVEGRNEVPAALSVALGQLLMDGKKPEAAIEVLETDAIPANALSVSYFSLLESAYAAAGRQDDVSDVRDYLLVLSPATPPADAGLVASNGHKRSRAIPDTPAGVQELARVAADAATRSGEEALAERANALAQAGTLLAAAAQFKLATRYRDVAAIAYYLRGTSITSEDALSRLEKTREDPMFERASPELRALGSFYEYMIDADQGRTLQAATALKVYYTMAPIATAEWVSEWRLYLEKAAFVAVSFDESGRPRTLDPDVFLDMDDVGINVSAMLHTRSQPGAGARNDKYSSVSGSEDMADSFAIAAMVDDLDIKDKLCDVMEQRIAKRKFEVLVKMALMPEAARVMDLRCGGATGTLGERLDREIRRVADPPVAPSTLEGYATALRLKELDKLLAGTPAAALAHSRR
jgi:tetratricopeptide (TPR) repeat protein